MSDELPATSDTFPLAPCPNCDAERVGPYCSACGQRFPEGRLTLGRLWLELPRRAFNFDQGWLHTFLELCRRPGRVARDYVEGKRRAYTNPLTYFLLAATAQLLGLKLAEGKMHGFMKNQVDSDPKIVEQLSKVFSDDPGGQLATIYIDLLQTGYTYLFLVFASIPFALYLRALTARLQPRYNLAEMLVFSIYTTGHLVLVTGLMIPITAQISLSLHAFLSVGLYVLYAGLAARGFYDSKYWRVILAVIAILGAFLTFVLVLISALVFTILSRAPAG